MKIVLTDAQTVVDEAVTADILKQFGEVEAHGLLRYEEVADKVTDADLIVCNKTLLNEYTLRKADRLRYIGLFATGYNNIDIEYCRKKGITVCNAGSYSTNAVAQHTFALILAHYNKVSSYNQYVQDGKWKRSPTFSPFVYPLNELAGKTIGIVGLGAIGQAVAKIALAFGMNVIFHNRSLREFDGAKQVTLTELLQQSALSAERRFREYVQQSQLCSDETRRFVCQHSARRRDAGGRSAERTEQRSFGRRLH